MLVLLSNQITPKLIDLMSAPNIAENSTKQLTTTKAWKPASDTENLYPVFWIQSTYEALQCPYDALCILIKATEVKVDLFFAGITVFDLRLRMS